MRLYLVQHGEANPKDVDPERHLSDAGKTSAEATAAFLEKLNLTVGEVWHSGKARALETARAIAPSLGAADSVVERAGLAPNDDVEPVADELATCGHDAMVVGHLPFLSRLASLLTCGNAESGVLSFRNAGIVCLGENAGQWSVEWVVTPEVLPR